MALRPLLLAGLLAFAGCRPGGPTGELVCLEAGQERRYEAQISANREGGWLLTADNGQGRRLVFQFKGERPEGNFVTGGLSEHWFGQELDSLQQTRTWFSTAAPEGLVRLARQAEKGIEGDFDLYVLPTGNGEPSRLRGSLRVAMP